MRQKIRSGRWTVPPTGHKKGGGIQGIRTASAAGAETLSDALGTRLTYQRQKIWKMAKINNFDEANDESFTVEEKLCCCS